MRADRLIQGKVRTRFLVTLDGEDAFEGVLVSADPAFFVFSDAWSVNMRGERVHVDTDLWLPRARIKYMTTMNP